MLKNLNMIIVVSFYVILVTTAPIGIKFIDKLPPFVQFVYVLLLFSTVSVYICFYYKMAFSKSKGVTRFSRGWYIFGMLLQYALCFISLETDFIIRKEQIPFSIIVLAVLTLFAPMIYVIKQYIDATENGWIVSITGLFAFILSELYMLMLFGMYNISTSKSSFSSLKGSGAGELFIRIIHHGSQYVFQFPPANQRIGIEPIVQFFIGVLFNTLVVGFFISYFSTLVKSKN